MTNLRNRRVSDEMISMLHRQINRIQKTENNKVLEILRYNNLMKRVNEFIDETGDEEIYERISTSANNRIREVLTPYEVKQMSLPVLENCWSNSGNWKMACLFFDL